MLYWVITTEEHMGTGGDIWVAGMGRLVGHMEGVIKDVGWEKQSYVSL